MPATLTFEDEDLRTLDEALQGMPYRRAAPVIASINRQLQAPTSPPGATPEPQQGRYEPGVRPGAV